MTVFPLRAIFMTESIGSALSEESPLVQMMVSVSKRHLRHAVDRNRQKRQIREAYRLNKADIVDLCALKGVRLYIAFVGLADDPCSSERIERSMVKLLRKAMEKLG